MTSPPSVHFTIALSLALVGVGCSPGTANESNNSVVAAPDQFTEEDRRVARTLSLGSDPTLDTSTDAYDHAVMCSVAMDHIARALRNNAGIQTAQRVAIDSAREFFADRLNAMAADSGKSRTEIDRDRARKSAEIADDSTKARLAMGCLQRPEGETPAA